jgi:hypothetical protein
LRLQDHLTSYASPRGSKFRCVVIRPLEANGRVVIPTGTIVNGTVRRTRPVGLGIYRERAGLELSFDSYETPDGHKEPLLAQLASIDNAREEVTPAGKIKGVLAANNPGNLINGFWFRPSSNLVFRSLIGLTGASNQVWLKASMGPIGVGVVFAVRCFIFAFPEPEIHLPPGTEMKLMMKVVPPTEGEEIAPPLEAPDELVNWLRPKLDQVFGAKGQPAADLMNLVMIGPRYRVISDFAAAGWSLADIKSLSSSSRVYRAFSSMQDYSTAPVSRILYRGAEPDLVFEKSLNSVAQRHHIRLWSAGVYEGDEVWLGAATHDTGIRFRMNSFRFTHRIDPDVDAEREKVSTDLIFAGCSETPQFFRAPADLLALQSARVSSDGRVSVLQLQSCSATSTNGGPAPPRPGNQVTRLSRRLILEARNYLLRDNSYYWAFRLLRATRGTQSPI